MFQIEFPSFSPLLINELVMNFYFSRTLLSLPTSEYDLSSCNHKHNGYDY